MMRVMNSITDKPEWEQKVFNILPHIAPSDASMIVQVYSFHLAGFRLQYYV